jgi:hypothetical protein
MLHMWRTRQKLREARFFLNKIQEHRYDNLAEQFSDPTAAETFSYYLSAFVSAARSVTWIMRSEYGRLPDWETWWRDQAPAAPVEKLLHIFTNLRNRSQKAEPLRLGHYLRLAGDAGPPVERDPKLPKMHVAITPVGDENEKPIFEGELLAFTWTVDDFDGADLLDSCRTYLEELEKLAASCETRFGVIAATRCM